MHSLALTKKIIEIRNVIIWHAYQRLGDRCWLDDWKLYKVVLGFQYEELPPGDICMRFCQQYHEMRSTWLPLADYAQKIYKHIDLEHMDHRESGLEYKKLMEAVIAHMLIGDGRRTLADDKRLYSCIPGLAADHFLPPGDIFLGDCQSFIDSVLAGESTLHVDNRPK